MSDSGPKKGQPQDPGQDADTPRQQVEHDENPASQGQGEGWAGTNPDEGEVEEVVPTEPVTPEPPERAPRKA